MENNCFIFKLFRLTRRETSIYHFKLGNIHFTFVQLSAGITSLCTVALIAVERMFVVCKPLGLLTFQKKHAMGGIALSWLWSLAWNLPPLFGWGRYELEGVGTSCAPDWHNQDPHNVSYILAYLAVCFAVPCAIIVISYAKLLWTLHQVI